MGFKFCITAQHLGDIHMALVLRHSADPAGVGEKGSGLWVREFLKAWCREGQSNGPQGSFICISLDFSGSRQDILQLSLGV